MHAESADARWADAESAARARPVRTPAFIYFDLGNVLLHFDHALACAQVGSLAGIPAAEVKRIVFDGGLQWRYEAGELDSRAFHEEFTQHAAAATDFQAFCHAASAIFSVNAPMKAVLCQLWLQRYRLGLLSNTCAMHWDYFASGRYVPIPDCFTVTALSYRLGALKPQRRIYEQAAALAGVNPDEIFFADDRPENVAGALEAGLDAVLFTSATALAADLARRGVRVNF